MNPQIASAISMLREGLSRDLANAPAIELQRLAGFAAYIAREFNDEAKRRGDTPLLAGAAS